jgi:energy-coupling factor transporter ATP-binding protein EcfA2
MITSFYTVRKHIATFIFVGLCVPFLVSADENRQNSQLPRDRKTLEIALTEQTKKEKKQLANRLLKSKANLFDSVWSKNSIISPFEKRELQIDDLITKCSRSVTAFGDIGLDWLLIPISNSTEIQRRQTIVQSLVQDEVLFNNLRNALSHIALGEDALLAYWKRDQDHAKVGDLYYNLTPRADVLNKSSLALEGGFWFSILGSIKSLAAYLCVEGVIEECLNPDVPEINLFDSVRKGVNKFARPLSPHSELTEEKLKNNGTFNLKNILYHQMKGTAGDRYRLCSILFGSYKLPSSFGTICGLGNAALSAIVDNAFLFVLLQYAVEDLLGKVQAVRELQINFVKIASLIRALDGLEKVVSTSPLLAEVQTAKYLQQAMNKNKWSDKLKQLMDLLNAFSFDTAGKKIFSAGQVLCAHKLLTEVKDELVPALQAVAEFDAYCSLAQLYKESQDTENRFVFAEFVAHETPQIAIDACWEPLVSDRQAVVNDIYLGAKGRVPRMMITGPNGCGKSTFLKSLGHAVIMAQSWGIVPAKKAKLTLFTGIRTSLDPKEDILNGISTFMAQRMRIGQVQDFVQASDPAQKILVMLDEPYRGTTDYLTEECIYDFGKEVAQLPNVVVCIATHVKKPVELARNGKFANYHVEIESLGNGEFKRLFTIASGAANKWLNDRQWMKDFVYWLDRDMQRNALKKTL